MRLIVLFTIFFSFNSFSQCKKDTFICVTVQSKTDVREEVSFFLIPKFEFEDSLDFFYTLNEHQSRLYFSDDKLIIHDIESFKNNIMLELNETMKNKLTSFEFQGYSVSIFELIALVKTINISKEPTRIPLFCLRNNKIDICFKKENELCLITSLTLK